MLKSSIFFLVLLSFLINSVIGTLPSPSGLNVASDGYSTSSLNITWNSVTEADSYGISYKNHNSTSHYQLIKSSELWLLLDDLPLGSYWDIKICAIKDGISGNESAISMFNTDFGPYCGKHKDQLELNRIHWSFMDDSYKCAVKCIFNSDKKKCNTECLKPYLGDLSKGCTDCLVDMSLCGLSNCKLPCTGGLNSKKCKACSRKYCLPGALKCTGIPYYMLPGGT